MNNTENVKKEILEETLEKTSEEISKDTSKKDTLFGKASKLVNIGDDYLGEVFETEKSITFNQLNAFLTKNEGIALIREDEKKKESLFIKGYILGIGYKAYVALKHYLPVGEAEQYISYDTRTILWRKEYEITEDFFEEHRKIKARRESFRSVRQAEEKKEEQRKEEKPFEERRREYRRKGLRGKISEWMKNTSYLDFENEICEQVKGQDGVKEVCLQIYLYLESMANNRKHKCNMILTAPSGCGKTETYRALVAYFKNHIPELVISRVAMESVTEEGYRGKDPSSIVDSLLENGNTEGIGLVFLDEFDKKIIPSFTSQGTNVNAAVQAGLLTIIEGSVVGKAPKAINTENTMFIALGSFNEIREKKEERKASIGFNKENDGPAKHYDDITREDMIELGCSYELLGRFSAIVNYHELDYASVDDIIEKNIGSLAKALGCQIEISDKFRQLLHENANTRYGCRLMDSVINKSASKGIRELFISGGERENKVLYLEDADVSHIKNQPLQKKKNTEAEAS